MPALNPTLPPKLGKHQKALFDFARRHEGAHSMTSRKSDPAHAALDSLSRRGYMVKLTVGNVVMFELPSEWRKLFAARSTYPAQNGA